MVVVVVLVLVVIVALVVDCCFCCYCSASSPSLLLAVIVLEILMESPLSLSFYLASFSRVAFDSMLIGPAGQ